MREDISVATGLSLYLLAVIGITAIGGRWPGVISAIISPLLANWYFIPPYHTFRINEGENLVELIVFISSAFIVSVFVSAAARRPREAGHAWHEAATLAALAESSSVDPVEGILELLIQSFQLDGVSIINVNGSTPLVISSAGISAPQSTQGADIAVPLDNDTYLAGNGETLSSDDRRLLHAFVGQLKKALQQRELREVALEADTLARADELRTAILRAVSHDLRSPLSSIKASVSSLRQNDIDWPEDQKSEFLESIESETDRLTSIVTNLLDLSRIEAGVLRPIIRSVSLEEIIPGVVHSIGSRASRIATDIVADAAEVSADPMLLERVVANLVNNALFWSPEDTNVTIRAYRRAEMIQILFIDHGPGIPVSERSIVIQPFHRLHDNVNDGGLGLGLAIADRLVAAMFGTLDLRDTPGGGLTVVISLPCVEADFS
jgi:two-component system sensor histidine kinase KdpD